MNNSKITILLGITGSIAAYKMADVASDLAKRGYEVQTIITKNGSKIINPIVFSTLTGNKCITKTFDENANYNVEHVSLAKKTNVVLVAPATANIIAKLANGIADDMLTTTVLACNCTKIVAPAMNTNMLENPVTQNNIQKLKEYGWKVIEPDSGVLACKDIGKGKLPKPEELVNIVIKEANLKKDLVGKNVLITAGPTIEAIDPVRFISNHSSGKMGYALAKAASLRGANVTLISGKTNLKAFPGVNKIDIESAQDMFEEVLKRSDDQDIIIKAAAVADYTPKIKAQNKIKKKDSNTTIELKRTKDILKTLGDKKRDDQILCGFSMETENLYENSLKKLNEKNVDLICANSLTENNAGFQTDTNVITMIKKDGVEQLEEMSKLEASDKILDEILNIIHQ